jgi:hypothetical protein
VAVKAALGTGVSKDEDREKIRGGYQVRVRLFGASQQQYRSGLGGVCGGAIIFLRDFTFFLGFSGYG